MTLFCAGDWDVGSTTLAAEVADLLPGTVVGERRHIDEVSDGRLVVIHAFQWDGTGWTALYEWGPTRA